MSRSDAERLDDIRAAISRCIVYRDHLDSAELGSMAYDAVLRNLAVVGEAAKSLPDDFKSCAPSEQSLYCSVIDPVRGTPRSAWDALRGVVRVARVSNDSSRWDVPASFVAQVERFPGASTWLPRLSGVAALWADRWGLTLDGPAMHGWTGLVWPVRDVDDRALVLKVSPPVDWTEAEPVALAAFASDASNDGPVRMVTARAIDVADRAILLPRLDPTRTLEDHPDIDVAVGVIAGILSRIAEVRPVPGIPPLSDHLTGLLPQLVNSPPVDPLAVARARGRVCELRAELNDVQRHRLLHGDCHFLNVLHSAPDQSPAWVGIDPAPLAGLVEWEAAPLLRNRWADASATGDPDRALRRRVDQVCEVTGGNRALVRACAQVQAVAALSWRMPTGHIHHRPYSVMAGW